MSIGHSASFEGPIYAALSKPKFLLIKSKPKSNPKQSPS